MSNLKHQTIEQLKQSKKECEAYILRLEANLSGQRNRLGWIEAFLSEKAPQELTLTQIEQEIGHKIIIKGE